MLTLEPGTFLYCSFALVLDNFEIWNLETHVSLLSPLYRASETLYKHTITWFSFSGLGRVGNRWLLVRNTPLYLNIYIYLYN